MRFERVRMNIWSFKGRDYSPFFQLIEDLKGVYTPDIMDDEGDYYNCEYGYVDELLAPLLSVIDPNFESLSDEEKSFLFKMIWYKEVRLKKAERYYFKDILSSCQFESDTERGKAFLSLTRLLKYRFMISICQKIGKEMEYIFSISYGYPSDEIEMINSGKIEDYYDVPAFSNSEQEKIIYFENREILNEIGVGDRLVLKEKNNRKIIEDVVTSIASEDTSEPFYQIDLEETGRGFLTWYDIMSITKS